MALQDYLDQAIKKICPIHGISFGKLDDKSTWRIDYADEATEDQKSAAQALMADFVWTDELAQQQIDEQLIEKYKNDLSVKAAYMQYKQINPNASFLDYLKVLESVEV